MKQAGRSLGLALLVFLQACSSLTSQSGQGQVASVGKPVVSPQAGSNRVSGSQASDSQISGNPAAATPLAKSSKSSLNSPVLTPKTTRQLPDNTGSDAVSQLLAQAGQLVAKGQLSLASAKLERGLRINARDVRIYIALAQLRLRQQQCQSAIEFAQKGLRYSRLSYERRKLQAVIDHCSKLSAGPSDVEARLG